MSENIGRLVTPDDPGYDESRWVPSHEAALVEGMEAFLARTSDDATSHEVYQRIRARAHERVVLSRLDPDA